MNKILVPKITFKDIIADEKRIETAYARLFSMARRNILAKRQLTNKMSQEYTEVQHERVSNNRGSIQEAKS